MASIFAAKSTPALLVGIAHTIRAMLCGDFPAPTLVLAGAHDPALEAAHLTHRTLPGAVLKRIPDAGYLSHLDQPDTFPNQMVHFLRGIEVDSGV
jgi:pimeloyl-ACP methyl ester carboxylesterase